MGYVLTVYNEKRYREFFLSEQDRAEQELLLLKQEFSCGETVRVRVKKTEAGWQLLDGATYTVWKDGRDYTGIIWQEQELLRLTLRDLTGAAMLIQKRDPVCCIYEKLALSAAGSCGSERTSGMRSATMCRTVFRGNTRYWNGGMVLVCCMISAVMVYISITAGQELLRGCSMGMYYGLWG